MIVSSCARCPGASPSPSEANASTSEHDAGSKVENRSDAATAIVFEDERSSGRCLRPLASACHGRCPDLRTLARAVFSDGGVVRCDAGSSSEITRGRCGAYSFIAIGTGYVSVTDWFDDTGTLIGESRGSDSGAACSYESALFGRVPICSTLESSTIEHYCASTTDLMSLLHPAWRTNMPERQPCNCAPGDPLCACP